MTPEEVAAYYDIPENARSMCDLLMRAHPGWTVRRLGCDQTFTPVPVWVARHDTWPASEPSLVYTNAGLLNHAMTTTDADW
jgi:hypothetical protein